ncbi:hypothetical protein B0H13DRAFT_1890394 [Mycena leptocephala]|nr:hypothetical protein B0H13DRAFT_1890394 [Mycena leptocephala]
MVNQGLALSGDMYQLTQGKKLAEKHGLFVGEQDSGDSFHNRPMPTPGEIVNMATRTLTLGTPRDTSQRAFHALTAYPDHDARIYARGLGFAGDAQRNVGEIERKSMRRSGLCTRHVKGMVARGTQRLDRNRCHGNGGAYGARMARWLSGTRIVEGKGDFACAGGGTRRNGTTANDERQIARRTLDGPERAESLHRIRRRPRWIVFRRFQKAQNAGGIQRGINRPTSNCVSQENEGSAKRYTPGNIQPAKFAAGMLLLQKREVQ